MGLGVAGIVWSVFRLLANTFAFIPLDAILPFHPSCTGFFKAFYIRPWTEGAVIAIGLFLVVFGWAVIWRHSWAQTLLVPAHLLFGTYALVGWIAAYALQADGSGPQTRWAPGPLVFLALALLNGGISLLLSNISTTEALSWLPLQTAAITPMRCEFCGASLDPQTGLCPECEQIPPIAAREAEQRSLRARLVSMDDDTTFWLDPNARTRIGRGLTGNDINLDNPTVSRQHAQIAYQEGRFVLTALNDANGTFVNQARVRERSLNDGDQVRFGRARFRFVVDETRGQEQHA